MKVTECKEIATAIQRTAYSAQEAGTPFDNLVSYITTVSEKTRKSAETIGESFKTIYARFSNIKLGNLDEDGKSINDTETAMNRIGISIRSSKNEFKQFDEVLNEFMQKFHNGELSQVDYLAGIQSLAGTRQRETLMALCENMDALNTHQKQVVESAGSAKKMFEEAYSDSLDAKVNDLKRSFEELYERILNSENLKWFIEQLTNIVTVLSTVDGETLAFIATVGSLSLALMKIVKIQKELMTMKAIGSLGDAKGISQFVSILGGMSSVTGNSGRAITGLNGAFLLLSNGIRTAIASSIAFMATPIGAVVSAIGLAVGLASVSFAKYKQAEEEAKQSSEAFKNSIEGVNNALKSGDTNTATEKIKEAQKEEEKLIELIEQRKEAEGHSQPSGINGINKVDSTSREIQQNIDALKELGYTVDETTGHIKELDDAKNKLKNTEVINSIKEETKAQLDNRMNLEQAQAEYNNYISTVQNLYSEYQTLSAQENLSAEDKSKLGQVVHQLQGKVSNLSVAMDENGKVYIQNEPLIQDTISYLTDEGVTVDTLSSIRISDAKVTSEWQIGNTTVTYNEINNRIEMYKAEIQAIRKLAEAKTGALEPFVKDNFFVNDRETAKLMGGGKGILEGITQASLASNAEYQEAQAKLKEFSQAKSKIDSIYNSMPSLPRGNSGGGSTPSKGSYTPSGGSGKGSKEKSDKGSKEKEVADLKIELDLYELQKNKIEQVTNVLEENKDKQDSLLTTEEERQSLMVEELQLYQDKWVKLNNLAGSYDQERRSLESYLRSQNLEIDALGNILNKNQILKEWEDWANASSGEEKERRIQQTKDLQKEIENYSKIVQTELPNVEKSWREVGKAMSEASMKMVSNVRDKLIEALKKDIESKQKDIEKANEDERTSKINKLDKQIEKLKKELASLDDDEIDKRKKLEALKRELNDWRKDDSTESTKKQQDLNTQIKDLEKELAKDALNDKISKLEEEKKETDKHYDKITEKNKKKYDKMLDEQEIYNKANKMMQEQNMQDIVKLIGNYGDSFKELGVLFGENMADALTSQVENALRQLAQVTGTEIKNDSSKWVADTGDHVKVNDVSGISVFSNPSGTSDSVKGTLSQQNINNGQEMVAKKYNNGFLLLETSDGDEIGWVDRHLLKKYNDIPKFATGGLIKTNSKEEKLGFLGDGEQVLQPQATKDMHDTFELVKDIQPVMESLQEIANKIDTNQLALYMNRINQPMNYMPNMTDLNRINSSVINNSTSNSVREGDISIQQTYNVTARSDFEEKKFANNLDRQFSATLRNAGLKK
ncbi:MULTISPECIES: phage tail tape measure protein [unclassified Clostridium]|uniref:phage tail tape measure protein n=1 Tax=unclassified Clostridium TaxID=2614128 RepID=UPI0020792B34|nr:phage tail tape measure protein [Clostridium sp. RO3]